MTALTIPNRRRSLFGAFRGGADDHVASTEALPTTMTERESKVAEPAADPSEQSIPLAISEASVARADEASASTAPAEPARGSVFSGTRAQIRLMPSEASTHPKSGRRGDLFVDSAGRLWFCRSGGKAATWKQVKLV